jgi:hypothetical protein
VVVVLTSQLAIASFSLTSPLRESVTAVLRTSSRLGFAESWVSITSPYRIESTPARL